MNKQKAKKIADTVEEATEFTVGGALRLVVRIILSVVMIFVITGLLFACIFAYYVKTELNSKLKITLEDASMDLSSTIWYTDSEGNDHELQMLNSTVKRIWVDYNNLPKDKMMEHALVAIEDKRFYEHRGVDWYRTAGAVVQMFFSMSNDFGGSTITQQLIKNNTENRADLVSRKLLEIFQAMELEKTYEKSEIIEWYLNTVYFGEGCYGVYTAAQTYFGKDVWDLSLAECASIVGITNNPSKYDPFIANTITDRDLGLTLTCREWNKYRQELVLQQMYEQGYITYSEYKSAVNEELNFVRPVNESYTQEIESFYIEMVKRDVLNDLKEQFGYSQKAASDRLYGGGLQIYCCLDPRIQSIVDDFYEHTENLPRSYYPSDQQLQSGMMIVDPYDGSIKAVAGAVGTKEVNAAWNYATDSKRQVGSSIKPLSVYGPALEYGLITQPTLVNDSANIHLSGTTWYTANSPNKYSGVITIRTALQQSKNTVAAQIVDKLTPQESYRYLIDKLGFTSLVEADDNYAPMALGALTDGATVREMTQAYTSFVNSGVMTYARSYTKVLDSNGVVVLNNEPKQVSAFSPNTAANINDMLVNAVSSGTGVGAGIPGMTVAGKTGTTAEQNDRYFVGYTPYYVAAVWTGYDTPETMYFEDNPALAIWHAVMAQVHEGLEYREFAAPEIGAPTNIFGNLQKQLNRQERERSKPAETPEPTEAPEQAEKPEQTEQTEQTERPAATQAPAETWAPGTDSGGENDGGGDHSAEPDTGGGQTPAAPPEAPPEVPPEAPAPPVEIWTPGGGQDDGT